MAVLVLGVCVAWFGAMRWLTSGRLSRELSIRPPLHLSRQSFEDGRVLAGSAGARMKHRSDVSTRAAPNATSRSRRYHEHAAWFGGLAPGDEPRIDPSCFFNLELCERLPLVRLLPEARPEGCRREWSATSLSHLPHAAVILGLEWLFLYA